MSDSWIPIAERIVFATLDRGHRSIAVTSAQARAGVTTLSETLARVTTLSGKRTLLIDLSGIAGHGASTSAWTPGERNVSIAIQPDPLSFSRLPVQFSQEGRYVFSNVALVRQALAEDFAEFEAIFVDLPPVPQGGSDRINGSAMAAACDGTLVVCLSGSLSRSDASACRQELENAQAKIVGVVMNDRYNPTLGAELAREARRLRRWTPRVSAWLERKALASVFLN